MLDNVDIIPSMTGKTVSDGRLNLFKAATAISNWGGCGSTVYCQSSPNSMGPGANITSSGSTSIGANDFRLNISGSASSTMGLFYYGSNQMLNPLGNGFRCVGGVTGRFNPVSPSDAVGTASRLIDFTAPPANSGPNAITAGSTWNFQYWYRDNAGGGAGFNFSDGLEAAFCP